MYSISAAAKYLSLSVRTLRRWDTLGKLIPLRTFGNHRRYTKTQLEQIFCSNSDDSSIESAPSLRYPIIYSRVSTFRQQQEGNLDRQVDRLIQFVKTHYGQNCPYQIIKEYGSGLNANRHGIQKLIREVVAGHCDVVIIEFEDRLTRFGFPYLEALFKAYNVSIVSAMKKSSISIAEQLTEDMLMLIASFSGKYYKLRANKIIFPNQNSDQKIFIQILDKIINRTYRQVVSRILHTK